jgi:mono/diheme cytochrome c family protein
MLMGLPVWAAAGALSAQEPLQRSLESRPDRLVIMQHHFTSIANLHEALIHGDLAAARARARAIATMPVPPKIPAAGDPYIAAIRAAAVRAADAATVGDAATATAAMLQQCGECHRQVGVFPPLRVQETYESVRNLSGHMREHHRGADQMLHGLVVPSTQQWFEGAERLSHAPLQDDKLQSERDLPAEIRVIETRVHQIAERATRAETLAERAGPYAELLTACASCHARARGN